MLLRQKTPHCSSTGPPQGDSAEAWQGCQGAWQADSQMTWDARGWHSWDTLEGEAGHILHKAEAHHKAMGTKKAWPRLPGAISHKEKRPSGEVPGHGLLDGGPGAAAEGPAADASREPLPQGTWGRDIPDGHLNVNGKKKVDTSPG